MKYKTVLLSLFLGFNLVIDCMQNGMQVQELKAARFKLELELSDLGKMIADKDDLLRSIKSKASEFISNLMIDENLDSEMMKEFAIGFDIQNKRFNDDLNDFFISKRGLKQFLMTELFREEDSKIKNFDTVKFTILRYVFEINLIRTLVEKYAEGQEEIFEIDQKIADLKK